MNSVEVSLPTGQTHVLTQSPSDPLVDRDTSDEVLQFSGLRRWSLQNTEDMRRFESKLAGSIETAPLLIRDYLDPILRRPGKRLRPALVMLAASFGRPNEHATFSSAIAVELVHTASLFHDDIIDESDQRRGQPALHTASGGVNAAVYAGNYLFQRANNFIQHIRLANSEDQQLLRNRMARAATDTCLGEIQECFALGDLQLGESEFREIIDRKTARLFQASCEAGALSTSGPLAPLSRFGRCFGQLYQSVDDLRDVLCHERELGKKPGSDLNAGVTTMPLIFALQEGGPSMVELSEILTDRRRTLCPEKRDRALELLRGSRGLHAAVESINKLAEEALGAIEVLPTNEACPALRSMIEELGAHTFALTRRIGGSRS